MKLPALPNGFDEPTNVMESGLLRALTTRSARDTGQAKIIVGAPAAAPPKPVEPVALTPVASPRPISHVIVIAGVVAVVVLAFDAWMVLHHRRATRPAAAAASAAPLPTYMLVPAEAASPPAAPPSTLPAAVPTSITVGEAVPPIAPSAAHKHRHGHHRHPTP